VSTAEGGDVKCSFHNWCNEIRAAHQLGANSTH
jgi:hypothetical protein